MNKQMIEELAITRRLLERAADNIPERLRVVTSTDTPGPVLPTWSNYVKFMEHTEFGLAWEMLNGLGKEHNLKGDFWVIMRKIRARFGDDLEI